MLLPGARRLRNGADCEKRHDRVRVGCRSHADRAGDAGRCTHAGPERGRATGKGDLGSVAGRGDRGDLERSQVVDDVLAVLVVVVARLLVGVEAAAQAHVDRRDAERVAQRQDVFQRLDLVGHGEQGAWRRQPKVRAGASREVRGHLDGNDVRIAGHAVEDADAATIACGNAGHVRAVVAPVDHARHAGPDIRAGGSARAEVGGVEVRPGEAGLGHDPARQERMVLVHAGVENGDRRARAGAAQRVAHVVRADHPGAVEQVRRVESVDVDASDLGERHQGPQCSLVGLHCHRGNGPEPPDGGELLSGDLVEHRRLRVADGLPLLLQFGVGQAALGPEGLGQLQAHDHARAAVPASSLHGLLADAAGPDRLVQRLHRGGVRRFVGLGLCEGDRRAGVGRRRRGRRHDRVGRQDSRSLDGLRALGCRRRVAAGLRPFSDAFLSVALLSPPPPQPASSVATAVITSTALFTGTSLQSSRCNLPRLAFMFILPGIDVGEADAINGSRRRRGLPRMNI